MQQASIKTNQDSILRLNEVCKRTGLSRTFVYEYAAAGKFPKQVKLGKRISGWSANAVQAWIDETLKNGMEG